MSQVMSNGLGEPTGTPRQLSGQKTLKKNELEMGGGEKENRINKILALFVNVQQITINSGKFNKGNMYVNSEPCEHMWHILLK